MQTGAEGSLFSCQNQCDSSISASLCTPAVLPLLTGFLWISTLISSSYRAQEWLCSPYSTKHQGNQEPSTVETSFPSGSLFSLPSKRVWWPSLYQIGPSITQQPVDSSAPSGQETSGRGRGQWCWKAAGTDRDTDCSPLRPASPGHPCSALWERTQNLTPFTSLGFCPSLSVLNYRQRSGRTWQPASTTNIILFSLQSFSSGTELS